MKRKPVRASGHLVFRLKARRIPEEVPVKVLRDATRRYFDRDTGYHIAVLRLPVGRKERVMMLVYEEFPREIIMITVCPISEQQESNRVRAGRWRPA